VFRIDDKVLKYLTVKLQDVFSPLPEDKGPAEAESAPNASVETAKEATEAETGATSTEA
jgi:hypothetical protein